MNKTMRTLAVMALVFGIHCAAQAEEPEKSPEQVRIAVQEICPVTGVKLGEHGKPIKAKIGKEELFLCCKGCLKGKVNPKHWATIHANFVKAQAKCPVMNKPLPENPKWTITEGRIIYICCPPCTKKIEADPETYLDKVDALYSASLESRSKPE